jgi:hypothetical protein
MQPTIIYNNLSGAPARKKRLLTAGPSVTNWQAEHEWGTAKETNHGGAALLEELLIWIQFGFHLSCIIPSRQV